jgi:hypothetical protein
LHDFHSQLSGQVHGDGIQHYCSPDAEASYDRYITGFKIFNNSFTGDFTQVSGSSGAMTALIYLSGSSKNVEIYNNVFAPLTSGTQTPNFFESFISLRDNPHRGGFHKIYNNTFVTRVSDGQAAALLEDDPGLPSPGLDVKNNIFAGFDRPVNLVSGNHVFDYNNIQFIKNVGKWKSRWVETFNEWQMLGNDLHGISADSRFVSPTDFHLLPGSPCEDRGALLDETYALDRDGEIRPQGSTFDLGAFETSKQNAVFRQQSKKSNQWLFENHNGVASLPDNVVAVDLCGRLLAANLKKSLAAQSYRPVIVANEGRPYIRPFGLR